jgi:hypothetical protein
MAAASGGLIALNGLGAVGGPLIVGAMMDLIAAEAFFLYLALLLGGISAYGLYRMTQRTAPSSTETGPYAIASMTAGSVAIEATTESVIEQMSSAPDEPEVIDVSDSDDSTPRAA